MRKTPVYPFQVTLIEAEDSGRATVFVLFDRVFSGSSDECHRYITGTLLGIEPLTVSEKYYDLDSQLGGKS